MVSTSVSVMGFMLTRALPFLSLCSKLDAPLSAVWSSSATMHWPSLGVEMSLSHAG